ncbi:MAG: hypothetical protein Q9169_001911 [Polycauliona sp. 2 TL-2023]
MERTDPHPFTLEDVDDASAALILQLQREVMEELKGSSKGKQRENEVSDIDLAIDLLQQDLQETSTILTDRCMSRSLARAVIEDSAFLTAEVAREDAMAHDRLVAQRIEQGGETDCSKGSSGGPELDDLTMARLMALYVSGPTEDETSDPDEQDGLVTGESSRWAAARLGASTFIRHECTSCGEQRRAFETFCTSCGHNYYQGCLSELFKLSTTDETLFPPRCCRQTISLTAARLYLDSDLVQRFQQKAIEFQSIDRTYCSRPTCSAFIPSTGISGERATCPICLQQTCTICKADSHDGHCPQDTATQQLLATAAEERWQRCYSCRRLVELDIGCNHMTLNSATLVENAGRLALVTNGTRIAWKLVQNRSWHVKNLKDPWLPHNRRTECSKLSNICALVIIAHMTAGAGFADQIVVRSAITVSRSTFSSADNAKSGHAIDAGGTGYESTKATPAK